MAEAAAMLRHALNVTIANAEAEIARLNDLHAEQLKLGRQDRAEEARLWCRIFRVRILEMQGLIAIVAAEQP